MKEQFDLFAAQQSRDACIEGVALNSGDFMRRAMSQVERLPPGEYTGEDIRRELSQAGILPHHHNAWGALICHAVRRFTLVNTHRVTQMRSVKSHARMTSIYLKES